jgi:hypothetical protein
MNVDDIIEGIWHDELFDENDCHKPFNPKKYGKKRLALLAWDDISKERNEILCNPDSRHWNVFFTKFTEKDVDKWTEQQDKRREVKSKIKNEESEEKHKALSIFDAKLLAFEIEEIKNSQNKKLRSRLRKSKSIIEINAVATMIMLESLNND